MANTATITASLSYTDASGSEELAQTALAATLTNAGFTRNRQSIPTSEAAINLAGLSGPGYALIINRDATNYVELKVATGGAIFAKLDANGGVALVKLGSGAQAPFAIANSATCIIDVFIVRT